MATAALPIRELSANVQYDAASAQKAFFEVLESKQQEALFNWVIWYTTHRFNRRMGRLLMSQGKFVKSLRCVPVDSIAPTDLLKVSSDLDRIVSMTDSLLADAYLLPEQCLSVWRKKLEAISDQNGYIESFAESFRIASDETCTALLAEVARKVAVEDTVSV